MSSLVVKSYSPELVQNIPVYHSVEEAKVQAEANLNVIEKLKLEFGASVAKEVWNKILPHLQEQYLQGTESLEPHEQRLKREGLKILLTHLKERCSEALERGTIPQALIHRWLLSQNPQQIRSFIRNEELFSEALAQQEKKYCQDVAKKNLKLIEHFKRVYSQEVVDAVYGSISIDRRSGLEKGTTDLVKFVHSFRSKCGELANLSETIGILPEGKELIDFFKTAKIEAYREGAQGVYFVAGHFKQVPLTVVVKVSDNPRQEGFATQLLAGLSIKTPSIHILDCQREPEAGQLINQALQHFPQYQERYGSTDQNQVVLMGCVPGMTLERFGELPISQEEEALPSLNEQVFLDIGQIAAADLLLYQRDRLPMIGMSNPGNLMIVLDEQKRVIGSAAIDQSANLSRDLEKRDHFSCDPFDRVRQVVSEIMKDRDQISSGIQAIYEDLFSESLKARLNEKDVLQALQKGVLLGLSKIMTCSPQLLEKLYESLPQTENEADRVDLEAYQQMLRLLQEVVLDQS